MTPESPGATDGFSERRLHDHFHEVGQGLPGEVILGPGDDMAMIEATGPILVAADQVVMGRHVRPDESPRIVGRKAVLRNLSDVAAMAARPMATIATATLGPDRTERWARELHAGLHETAMAWNAPLVGGDLATTAGPNQATVVSVTIIARPALPNGRILTRTGARPGDLLATTGRLGGSLDADGGGRHLDFTPRIEEAIALATSMGGDLVAMMDLSDGVAQDAGRLARLAGATARLEAAQIPTIPDIGWERALTDGEDYELLLACRREPPPEILGIPVTVIGRLEAAEDLPRGAVVVSSPSGERRVDHLGWEHRTDA